ncbi:MAG: SDR family oxidoreductase [Pseudomonadales bacterium]|nr:SDR family oxidoreductase [Pseudomonadales bacterium]
MTGKLLVLTGASSGIGLATAERFCERHYRVINISRRPCPLDGVQTLSCDLSVPHFENELASKLASAIGEDGEICLVHNAATYRRDKSGWLTNDELRRVLEVNLLAPNALPNLVVPRMRAGSSVLYVGSTLSEQAVANTCSYTTSKHALAGMMKALCQDLSGSGVHTAMICPGFTDTEMLRAHTPAVAMPTIKSMTAFGRLIEPSEIAAALHWAACSPVINGSVVHANLGQLTA